MKKKDLYKEFLRLESAEALVDFFSQYQALKEKPISSIKKRDVFYYLFSQTSAYNEYTIEKPFGGKKRKIEAPKAKLKAIQRILNEVIQEIFTPKRSAHGFVKGRSIVSNAKKHIGKKYVYNLDLKDFFPSIHFGRVKGVFKSKPFQFSEEMSRILATLCCNKGRLPQGAPTSPVLSNLVCRSLDTKLSRLAKVYKAQYSRYADDITFSCNENVFAEAAMHNFIVPEIRSIILEEGFKINPKKTRLRDSRAQQSVTGIIVNKKPNVHPQFKKDLQFLLHLWDKHGSENAQAWLNENYKRGHRYNGNTPKIDRVIEGKLNYLKMVVGTERSSYKRLLKKYQVTKRRENPNISKIEELTGKLQEISLHIHENIGNETSSLLKQLVLFKKYLLRLNLLGLESFREWDFKFSEFKKNIDLPHFIENIFDKEIINPLELIHESISEEIKPYFERNLRFAIQNPLKMASTLELFRTTSHPFGELLHSSDSNYFKLVESAWKLVDVSNRSKLGLPEEILNGVVRFVNFLLSKKDFFKEETYSNFLNKDSGIIVGFKKAIRFGQSNDEVKMSDLIVLAIKSCKNDKKIWYCDFDEEKINADFQDVFNSVKNIYEALKLIMLSMSKHSQTGALKIESELKNNQVFLRIIDLESISLKKAKVIVKDSIMKGDLKKIRSILYGYVNLVVKAKFPEGQYHQVLLTENEKPVIEILEEEPEGFIYELGFSKQLSILLLDDKIRERDIDFNSSSYNNFLSIEESFHMNLDLNSYNAIFIHKSIDGYNKVDHFLRENDIPVIRFSGGNLNPSYDNPHSLIITDKQFYGKLEQYLKRITKDFDVYSFKEFLDSQYNYEDMSIEDLISEIERQKYSVGNLPEKIKNNITQITKKTNIPIFNNLKQLAQYLELHT